MEQFYREQFYRELIAQSMPGVLVVTASVAAIALLQSQGHYSYCYV